MTPVKKFHFDKRFKIDTGTMIGGHFPDYVGYQLSDLIVRIHNWYDEAHPQEFQVGLRNVSYGILVDVEDGDQRLSTISHKPYRILKEAGSDKDRKDKDVFEDRFKAAGTPITNEEHKGFWQGLYLISLPVPESCGTSPEKIKEAQENLIRHYIDDMRKEWDALLHRMKNEKHIMRSEFDTFSRKLMAEEPHGRWELVRGFMTNAIREKDSDKPVSHFKTFLEWLCDKELIPIDRSTPVEEAQVKPLLEKLALPLEEGRVYQMEVDWALPYILSSSDDKQLISALQYKNTKEVVLSREYYYPYDNFLFDYPGKSQITISEWQKTYTLNPTGYTLLSLVMHYIVNIEYLQHQNYEALRPYYNYITRLAQIKAKLCGKDGKGPFVDLDMGMIRKEIQDLEDAGYEYTELPDSNPFNAIKNPYVENDKEKQAHINQLLLGIGDIEKLEQLFKTIIENENVSQQGRNYSRNTAIEKYTYDMRNLMGLLNNKNKFWDQSFVNVWRFNTYPFGPIMFLHKSHLHFARSGQSEEIYNVFFKKLIFDSPNFVAHGERKKREKNLRKRGTGYSYYNWFWKFDEYITTLYLNNLVHHSNSVAETFDPASGGDPATDELERMLKYLHPDIESVVEGINQFKNSVKMQAENSDNSSEIHEQLRTFNIYLTENSEDNAVKALEDKIKETERKLRKKGAEIGNSASLMGNMGLNSIASILNAYSVILISNAYEWDIDNFSKMELASVSLQTATTGGQIVSFYNKVGYKYFKYFKFLQGAKAGVGIAKYCGFASWVGVGICGVSAFGASMEGDYKDAVLMTVAGVGQAMVIVGGGLAFSGFGTVFGLALIGIGASLSYLTGYIDNQRLWDGEVEEFIRHALKQSISENGMDNFDAFEKDHGSGNNRLKFKDIVLFMSYPSIPHCNYLNSYSLKNQYKYEGRPIYHTIMPFDNLSFIENICKDEDREQLLKMLNRSKSFIKNWDIGDLYDGKISFSKDIENSFWDWKQKRNM